MATRTVKLRLHVPRIDDTAHRKALWTTHQVLNEAAAYYESYLLQMRQAEYETADGLVSKESVATNLKATVQTAQKNNSKAVSTNFDKIFKLLRALYEMIEPSALPGKSGTAQGTRDFIGPLTSASSGGWQKVFEQLERARRNWLADLAAQRQQLFEEGMRGRQARLERPSRETAKSAAWEKLSTNAAANNHAAWPDRLTKYLEVKELTKDELSQREHVAIKAGVKRVTVTRGTWTVNRGARHLSTWMALIVDKHLITVCRPPMVSS